MKNQRFSAMWSERLNQAILEKAQNSYEIVRVGYKMSLVGDDAHSCFDAVNQGIDAHLEACFVPSRGDKYHWEGNRLECVVSPESLPVLVRRLLDDDDISLSSSICETLGIELV